MRMISPVLILSIVLVVATAKAQFLDSILIINPDDVITALKFKKKGVMPFGFKPGTSILNLKKAMGMVEIFKEDSTYITYTLYFSKDKYDFGDITYEFIDSMLTEVSMETYFGDKKPAVKTLNLFKKHFDKIYKGGTYANNTLNWEYTKKGVHLKVHLAEVEFEDDNGFVIDFLTGK